MLKWSWFNWNGLAVWKVFFGILAVLDLWICCIELGGGGGGGIAADGGNRHHQGGGGKKEPSAKHHHNENRATFDASTTESNENNYAHLFLLIAIGFNVACVVESVVRGHLARQLALEDRTLRALEDRLQRGVRSTLRSSLHLLNCDNEKQLDEIMAKTTSLRTYFPMFLVIVVWLSLLPMTAYYWDRLVRSCGLPFVGISSGSGSIMMADHHAQKHRGAAAADDDFSAAVGGDAALATYYITQFISHFSRLAVLVQDVLAKIVWDVVMPYHIVFQPRRWLARVKVLLRAIKYVRFAFPLCRIGIKVLDQLFALRKVYTQSAKADANMRRRRGRPSLLLSDLRRVESLAKVQMNLAKMNSQIFQYCASGPQDLVQKTLRYHQVQGRQLRRFFRQIKRDIRRNSSLFLKSDQYYDTIVRVAQQLRRNTHSLLFASHNLLSPRSRFSIIWRLTVTNVLLLEIVRLALSYHLSDGTFQLGIRHMIRQTLYIHCEVNPRGKEKFWQDKFAAIGKVVHDVRHNMSKALPILPAPKPLLALQQELCIPSSRSARLVLQMGGAVEHFIDLVSFLDIFIWFYTGDIDDETGLIVPKPFITRAIIPGTLVQVLDHPTLPELLPSLIRHFLGFCRAIGYARAIRWMLAIFPCCAMAVRPVKSYVFDQTVDTSRGIMSYVESLGMLGPGGSSAGHVRQYSDGGVSQWDSSMRSYSSSQLGMSFEDSLRTLHDDDDEPEEDDHLEITKHHDNYGNNDHNTEHNTSFETQYHKHRHARFIHTSTATITDDGRTMIVEDTDEVQQEEHLFRVVTPSPFNNLRQRRRQRIAIRSHHQYRQLGTNAAAGDDENDEHFDDDDPYRFSYSPGGELHHD